MLEKPTNSTHSFFRNFERILIAFGDGIFYLLSINKSMSLEARGHWYDIVL